MTSNDKLVPRLENLNDPRLVGLIKDVRNFQYHDLCSPLENPRAVLAHKLLVSGYPSIATEVAAGKFAPSMDEISVWTPFNMVADANYLYWLDVSAGSDAGVVQRLKKKPSSWAWPVDDPKVTQRYAAYNDAKKNSYHTGDDIKPVGYVFNGNYTDSRNYQVSVKAVPAGVVAKIIAIPDPLPADWCKTTQPDPVNRVGGSGCVDHGLGNTVISST